MKYLGCYWAGTPSKVMLFTHFRVKIVMEKACRLPSAYKGLDSVAQY